jgi:hypothetical protein
MRDITRRAMRVPLVASIMLAGLVGGSVALASPTNAAVASCSASIDPGPTVVLGTEQTLTVTGLTPNNDYDVTSTHNGTPAQSSGTTDATGTVQFTQAYALGTWTYEYQDLTTTLTCSVSWTVVEETPTTTTMPTTAAPSDVSPAAAISAAPTFTG